MLAKLNAEKGRKKDKWMEDEKGNETLNNVQITAL